MRRWAALERRSLLATVGKLPAVLLAIVPLPGWGSPLSLLSEACTEATLPEFDANLEISDCLLLRERLAWRGGARPPLVIRQNLVVERMGSRRSFGSDSTGSAVWGGGLALARYMEEQGQSYWRGKRVLELGCGTGIASITALKLGAASAVATDGDAAVLTLAAQNAERNLDPAQRAGFSTAVLSWGGQAPNAFMQPDLVLGADITYARDAWPALAQTLRSLRAHALLAASERRPGELAALSEFLTAAGLSNSVLESPLRRGYARDKIRILRLEPASNDSVCEITTVDEEYAVEPTLAIRCEPAAAPRRARSRGTGGS